MGIKDIKEKRYKEHGSEYKDRKEKGYRVISPSGAKNFVTNKHEWSVNVLDGKPTFFGNEASTLGSVVHRYIEMFREGSLNADGTMPKDELDHIVATTTNIDTKGIYADYKDMCKAVKEIYLDKYPTDVLSEKYFELELTDRKVLVAGTVDELDLNNKIICDFKTCSKPVKDQTAFIGYLYQLSVYYALMKATDNIEIDKFRIVFIQRPTKTIGSRIYIAECDSVLDLGQDLLNDIIKTIDLCDSNPELKDIIFTENPLSGFTNPSKENIEAFSNKYIKNFKLITEESSKLDEVKKNIFAN